MPFGFPSERAFSFTGIPINHRPKDLGRYLVTGKDDKGRFRTLSLRNVANTPRYMHDGSPLLKAEPCRPSLFNRGSGSRLTLTPTPFTREARAIAITSLPLDTEGQHVCPKSSTRPPAFGSVAMVYKIIFDPTVKPTQLRQRYMEEAGFLYESCLLSSRTEVH
jgi:hypothetical protein